MRRRRGRDWFALYLAKQPAVKATLSTTAQHDARAFAWLICGSMRREMQALAMAPGSSAALLAAAYVELAQNRVEPALTLLRRRRVPPAIHPSF
jgi:hypothetical protein